MRRSIERSRAQLVELGGLALARVGPVEAAIFEAHQMFLDDEEFINAIRTGIDDKSLTAEAAIEDAVTVYADMLLALDDEYFRARAADLRDVGLRLIRNASGGEAVTHTLSQPSIIVADDLSPSDTIQFDRQFVLGLCTARGGPTSHVAILSRGMGVPAIVSARFDLNVASRIRGKILDVVLSENQAVKELGKFSMARTQSWRDDVRAGMQALLLQNQGKINGIWASFDGQAYIIDDLLQAQGVKKGQIPLVSVDGGKESYERIADPNSTLMATVAVPFEEMGKQAVDAVQAIVVDKKPKESVTSGPYLFTEAVLVDKNNVQQFMKK